MIACICLGLGETILLFLCGLLGICKLCAKKHLKCKDQHCHDKKTPFFHETTGPVVSLDEFTGSRPCETCQGLGHLNDADLGAPATRCEHCKGKGVIDPLLPPICRCHPTMGSINCPCHRSGE